MLKIRLGAVPDTEVKMPQVPPGKAEHPLLHQVRGHPSRGRLWSCEWPWQADVGKGRIGSRKLRISVGRHLMLLKVWSYKV